MAAAVHTAYSRRTLMLPPDVRSTSFGPPALILPLSESSACLPTTVTGSSLSTPPPLACASRSRFEFAGSETVMLPPEVESFESARGAAAKRAVTDPPAVDASTVQRASSILIEPPEVRA